MFLYICNYILYIFVSLNKINSIHLSMYPSIHPSIQFNLIESNPTQSNPNQSVDLCFHPTIFPYNMANLTFQIKHFIYLEVPLIDHFHRHSCVGLPRNFSHLPPHTGFQVLQSCPVETADAVQFDFGIRTMENQWYPWNKQDNKSPLPWSCASRSTINYRTWPAMNYSHWQF